MPFTLSVALAIAGCELPGQREAERAEVAFAEQDYLGARNLALKALNDNSDSSPALIILVRAQLAMGDGAAALANLERLRALDEPPSDIDLLAAEAHLQMGNLLAAKPLLTGSNTAESWRLRALAASLQDDTPAALRAFAFGREAVRREGPTVRRRSHFSFAP